MTAKHVSVLIPVLNGEKLLSRFFVALSCQSLQPQEIIVADSQSTDNSVAVCEKYGARVISIRREEFDHGTTRKLLAEEARGEILVYFTQDALLTEKDSLQRLITALTASKDIACVYGRQLPAKDATLQAASLRIFNYPPKSEIRQYSDHLRYGLKTVFISNSYAAYKKDKLLVAGGFQSGLIFGEDTCILGKLLALGYKVAYCAEAAVFHSHNYSLPEEFRRSFDIGVLHSAEKWLVDTYGGAASVGGNFVRFALQNIMQSGRYHLLGDWLIRNGVKFLGYRAGRMYTHLPKAVCMYCSMNRLWWNHR